MATSFEEAVRQHDIRVQKRMDEGLPCDNTTYDNILSKDWPDFVEENIRKADVAIIAITMMAISFDNGIKMHIGESV